MKILNSTFNSVKNNAPVLVKKLESMVKGKKVKEAGSGKEIELIESKIIAKEKKGVKESFANFIHASYAAMDQDIHPIKSNPG